MSFTEQEVAYLRAQPLARLSTLGGDGQPDVVPVAFEFDPFIARGVRVYGKASPPIERRGLVGPGSYIQIEPKVSWSWNMEGEPVGDTWYESRRTDHFPARGLPSRDRRPQSKTSSMASTTSSTRRWNPLRRRSLP